jgi:hypothetical protein
MNIILAEKAKIVSELNKKVENLTNELQSAKQLLEEASEEDLTVRFEDLQGCDEVMIDGEWWVISGFSNGLETLLGVRRDCSPGADETERED